MDANEATDMHDATRPADLHDAIRPADLYDAIRPASGDTARPARGDGQAAAAPGGDSGALGPNPGRKSAAMPESLDPSWAIGRRFMLRVAGLPIDTVHALRCPDSARWARRTLAEEHRLRASGAALSDRLYELVGANDDEAARRALLRLRRELFNNRLPRDQAGALALVSAVGGERASALADDLNGWLADRRQLAELYAAGEPLLADELAASRVALRRIVDDDQLRRGLLLASPTLDGQLDAFVADTSARPGKRQRKIERSVLSYLYRTACKTSPFSTFTAVALGDFHPVDHADHIDHADRADHLNRAAPADPVDPADPADPADNIARTDTSDAAATAHEMAPQLAGQTMRLADEWTSHPRLNVVVLGRLVDLILADPQRRGDLPLALASGWDLEDDRVRYVRRSVTAGDNNAAVTFDAVSDRLFFLRRTGVLERMIALFEDRGTLRHRDLVRWLAEQEDADPAECARYVSALMELGMVRVPCLSTDVHSPDPLRSFRAALHALDRPWADALFAGLADPIALVDRYAAADTDQRRHLLRELRRTLHVLQEELGAPDGTLPQTLMYEDVTARGADGELAYALDTRHGVLGEPLRAVERLLPAFDLTLPQRLTFKGFFQARFGVGGRCDDLLRLVHDFHEDFFDQYLTFTARRQPFDAAGDYVPEENWLGLPQIGALDAARREFITRMRELWTARAPGAAEALDTPVPEAAPRAGGPADIELDDTFIEAVADQLAPLGAGFAPQSHFVQLVAGEQPAPAPHDGAGDRPAAVARGGDPAAADAARPPLAVLNRSYGGLAFPFSRFTHCYDGATGPDALSPRLRAEARAIQPAGAVFAEITGGAVTSNLNLHGRLTDYEIVCPGETSSVPEADRIELDDLYVEHDPRADRLALRSRRLGREVIPVYLGYLVPLALPEIPRTLLLLSPTSMAPLDVWAGVPEGPATDGVTRRPRVAHRGLVLSRRSWATTVAQLPARAPGDTDAGWFAGWHRWRLTHGIPDRVFATVSAGPGRAGAGVKPQYVDFDSPLSLAALEALLGMGEARVVLREALPGEDALHVTSTRGRHVAELAVETITHQRQTAAPPPRAHPPTTAAHPVVEDVRDVKDAKDFNAAKDLVKDASR